MMQLGNNEIIALSLMKSSPTLTEKSLQLLFLYVTGKKGRMDLILHSLQIKGLIDEKNTVQKEMLNDLDLPPIEITAEILNGLDKIHAIRLGNIGKEILFLLSITEKASLQFLSVFFRKSPGNIYAILQRLEEKECAISYNSKIMRYSINGRKYYPKYYTITDLGKLLVKVHKNSIKNREKIKNMLKMTEEQIKKFVL